MVEFELTDPSRGFLLGIDLLDGYTDDIEPGTTKEVGILSIGLLLFKISFLWIK